MTDARATGPGALRNRGFVLRRSLLQRDEIESLRNELERFDMPKGRGGVRGLLGRSRLLHDLIVGSVGRFACSLVGHPVRAVKLTLFDKTPGSNWTLPLHQDRVVVVDRREDVEGFGPWTVKNGQPHAQAPAEVLSSLLAVRVHLDDAPEDGGALRVIPGSHTHGTLSRLDMETLLKEKPVQVCPANSGDAFAMRPLLLHGSLPAQRPDRRRVLHFEFATGELPPPLLWPEGSILVPDSEVR